ncbi:MAG: hypothetical protein M1370_04410 [Bacteroidetes bacterium]|nr:hypothetical protein [Bacteroidota bacterium]
MMYDQNGNAQIAVQARATKDYGPSDLGMNAVVLPASGQKASNWVSVKGYSRLVAVATADRTFQVYVELALDASGTGGAVVVSTANNLVAGTHQMVCNQGQSASGYIGADKATSGGVWNYARVVVGNATASAGTTTAYLHLQA